MNSCFMFKRYTLKKSNELKIWCASFLTLFNDFYIVIILHFFTALPSVNLELATRNYLGGPLDSSLLDEEVMEAEHKDSVPLNASRISLSDLEVTHGVEVEEFITSECRTLDIWNEKRPENSKLSKARDRCVVM